MMKYRTAVTLSSLLFLTMLGCTSTKDAATSAVVKEPSKPVPPEVIVGCHLNHPINIQTETILRGAQNILTLNKLETNIAPIALDPSLAPGLELQIYEQGLSAGSGVISAGFAGYRMTVPGSAYLRGGRAVLGINSEFHHEVLEENGIKKFVSFKDSEQNPAWKLEVGVKDHEIVSIQVGYRVLQPSGMPLLESVCITEASVKKAFD